VAIVDESDKDAIKKLAESRELDDCEDNYMQVIKAHTILMAKFLKSIQDTQPQLGRPTAVLTLASVISFIAKDRDDMFGIITDIRESLEKIDSAVSKTI
jgi:hypothetical protein